MEIRRRYLISKIGKVVAPLCLFIFLSFTFQPTYPFFSRIYGVTTRPSSSDESIKLKVKYPLEEISNKIGFLPIGSFHGGKLRTEELASISNTTIGFSGFLLNKDRKEYEKLIVSSLTDAIQTNTIKRLPISKNEVFHTHIYSVSPFTFTSNLCKKNINEEYLIGLINSFPQNFASPHFYLLWTFSSLKRYSPTVLISSLKNNMFKYYQDVYNSVNTTFHFRADNVPSTEPSVQQINTNITYTNIILVVLLIATWAIILTYLIKSNKRRKSIILLKEKNNEILDQKEELAATLNMLERLNAKLDSQNEALNKSALVAILHSDGTFDSVNRVFTKITGYTTYDLIQTDFKELLPFEHHTTFEKEILDTVRKNNTWRGELHQIKKDKSSFWVDAVFVPLKSDQENYQIYVVQFDITDRVKAEDKLIQQNENLVHMNQLKNKLFSIVSHDFRSPLKSLQGTLTLLNKGAVTTEELKTLSGNLLAKVENTSNFLENILNWAKSQMQGVKLKPHVFNIHQITEELIKLLKPQADKKFLNVINNVSPEINVVADLEMIKLVLRNLISNAIKFSYEEGRVEIHAEVQNDTAIISVTDHGTGIEDSHLENIFNLENYSKEGTAKETGVGLGLILSKDFVEQNNGKIWVKSEYEKGSTFSFSLPIVENLSEPELIRKA